MEDKYSMEAMGLNPETDFMDQMEPDSNDTAVGCLCALIFCGMFWVGVIAIVGIIFK